MIAVNVGLSVGGEAELFVIVDPWLMLTSVTSESNSSAAAAAAVSPTLREFTSPNGLKYLPKKQRAERCKSQDGGYRY